jgi:hypothetical protein
MEVTIKAVGGWAGARYDPEFRIITAITLIRVVSQSDQRILLKLDAIPLRISFAALMHQYIIGRHCCQWANFPFLDLICGVQYCFWRGSTVAVILQNHWNNPYLKVRWHCRESCPTSQQVLHFNR